MRSRRKEWYSLNATPRIVVIGGAGMLGHKMFQVLRERFPGAVCTMLEDPKAPPLQNVTLLQGDDVAAGVDVMDTASLSRLLASHRPDYVVNCVGVIKQRAEAQLPIPSIAINSLLPHQLAAMAATWGGKVVHFSTDCVFSGKRGRYTEDDPSDAEDLYGRSKYLGEVAAENALTLRSSIIGRELMNRKSLLEWFLSQNHRTVKGFRRAVYSGVTTNEMANVVSGLITSASPLSGLYHVVSEPITKHDLLRLLRDAYALDIEIVPDDADATDRSLIGDRFREATGYVAPPWPELTRNLADDPTPYGDWVSE